MSNVTDTSNMFEYDAKLKTVYIDKEDEKLLAVLPGGVWTYFGGAYHLVT